MALWYAVGKVVFGIAADTYPARVVMLFPLVAAGYDRSIHPASQSILDSIRIVGQSVSQSNLMSPAKALDVSLTTERVGYRAANVAFGMSHSVVALSILWGINGFFQGSGWVRALRHTPRQW